LETVNLYYHKGWISMKRNEIIERLSRACQNAGLPIDMLQQENFPLELDSIEFITLIIEIENEFGIEWEDDVLDINMFKSLDYVCDIVE